MKKTSKPNVLKLFNDNKASAAKKASASMSAFKKSLPKAQNGAAVSGTANQYKVNPYTSTNYLTRQGPLTEGYNNFLNAQATGAQSSVPFDRVRKGLEKTKRTGSGFNTNDGKNYLEEFPTIAGDNYVRARTDAEQSMMSMKKGGAVKRKK